METFLLVLDLAGTFVFALSGAIAGVRRRLDLFGVLVLSYAACNAGGIARDLLIGAGPPAAMSDWRYLAVSLLAGSVTFCRPSAIDQLRSAVLLFDAAGLALFAVAGTQKALAYGLHPVMAALLGVLTGIGGGMTRDVLLAEIPTVLRADLYAVAAPGGATASRVAIPHILPSTVPSVSASATFFLSWLNPPPHPITVYASHPPSPTTAQHSLPGGALLPYRGRSFTGRNASASPDAPVLEV
jgi:uncharacterized membrane protein YeiH